MLTDLQIRNLAIIDKLDIDTAPGFTVLTGETGAGKSILINALTLGFGERADASAIRTGSDRADISLAFDVSRHTDIRDWLKEQELDSDDECLIRRTLSRSGRSRGFINGQPVPMQTLKALGDQLLDLHGQHAHQSLLHRSHQRELLDAYAGHDAQLRALQGVYATLHAAQQHLDALRHSSDSRQQRLQLVRYQLEELDELALGKDEWQQLQVRHRKLANINQILAALQTARELIYDNDDTAAYTTISHAINSLAAVADDRDAGLTGIRQLLETALVQVQEARHSLEDYAGSLHCEPEELLLLDQRLAQVQDIARKHRVEPDTIAELTRQLQQEAHADEADNSQLEQLAGECVTLRQQYLDLAKKLGKSRRASAAELGTRVTEVMAQLGMPEGCFEVTVEPVENDKLSPQGLERVSFLVSANPGQPPQPLARVASGGELSRISLAIHVITAKNGRVPTLVFDEVDVGIGGSVAEVVGRVLQTLGESRQVLCITHLPQVAALGNQHYKVEKSHGKSSTRTAVRPLATDERIDEIARMVGGLEVTDSTLAHAREMVERGSKKPVKKKTGRKRG